MEEDGESPFQILSMDARQTCWHLTETEKRKRNPEPKFENTYTDHKLENWVIQILSQFLMAPIPEKTETGIEGLRVSNIGDIIECVVMDCFSEAFADLEACIRLNAALPDYITAFIYEKWNLDIFLAQTEPNCFRIPVILRICFSGMLSPDQQSLSAKAR